jgi:hypothetical protein
VAPADVGRDRRAPRPLPQAARRPQRRMVDGRSAHRDTLRARDMASRDRRLRPGSAGRARVPDATRGLFTRTAVGRWRSDEGVEAWGATRGVDLGASIDTGRYSGARESTRLKIGRSNPGNRPISLPSRAFSGGLERPRTLSNAQGGPTGGPMGDHSTVGPGRAETRTSACVRKQSRAATGLVLLLIVPCGSQRRHDRDDSFDDEGAARRGVGGSFGTVEMS